MKILISDKHIGIYNASSQGAALGILTSVELFLSSCLFRQFRVAHFMLNLIITPIRYDRSSYRLVRFVKQEGVRRPGANLGLVMRQSAACFMSACQHLVDLSQLPCLDLSGFNSHGSNRHNSSPDSSLLVILISSSTEVQLIMGKCTHERALTR
jgi:hypothetical protein